MYLETKMMLSSFCNKKCLNGASPIFGFELTEMFNKQMGISVDAQHMF
jgi:hypothetical protein